jgi:integration host factor subunit beta
MKINKKDIIDRISRNQDQLPHRDIELAVKTIINCMTQALSTGERIELRGFGSFSLRYRKPRIGRNPKSGIAVNINERYVPHFKPGKNLKNKVNKGTD